MATTEPTPCALRGLRVLVTRPAAQAVPFRDLLTAAGGVPVPFPVLAIEAVPARLQPPLDGAPDLVVFTSANAVAHGLPWLRRHCPLAGARVAAIGRQTAARLQAAGQRVDLVPPPPFTSEALLALPELARLAGQRLLIVRGEGGRTLLAEQLAARGARVHHLVAYRRVRPATPPEVLARLLRTPGVDVVAVTSVEALHNLLALAGTLCRAELLARPLLVGSARMAGAAARLGFRHPPLQAASPADRAMLDALCQWVQEQEESP